MAEPNGCDILGKAPDVSGELSLNILVIQLGDIGDVVLTGPTLEALKKRYPLGKLGVCVRDKALGIVEDDPHVDDVFAVRKSTGKPLARLREQVRFFQDIRRRGYDVAVDLRTGTRGALLALLSGAKHRIGRYAADGGLWRNRVFTCLVRPRHEFFQYAAGHNLNILTPLDIGPVDETPKLFVPTEKRRRAKALSAGEGLPPDTPFIVFHPFSLWHYKEWKISSCVDLVNHVTRYHGLPVIITGAPDERARASRVVEGVGGKVFNLAGKTEIGLLPALIGESALFIGVDTAALHIAAALDVPTIAIFGPTSPTSWAPRGKRHVVVSKPWPCLPCRRKGCNNGEHSRCLDELELDDIRNVVDERISAL